MHNNFWSGEKVRLRAIEEKDFAEISSDEVLDTEMDWFEGHIRFPSPVSTKYDQLKYLTRERTEDASFWLIENLVAQKVGYFNIFDCE